VPSDTNKTQAGYVLAPDRQDLAPKNLDVPGRQDGFSVESEVTGVPIVGNAEVPPAAPASDPSYAGSQSKEDTGDRIAKNWYKGVSDDDIEGERESEPLVEPVAKRPLNALERARLKEAELKPRLAELEAEVVKEERKGPPPLSTQRIERTTRPIARNVPYAYNPVVKPKVTPTANPAVSPAVNANEPSNYNGGSDIPSIPPSFGNNYSKLGWIVAGATALVAGGLGYKSCYEAQGRDSYVRRAAAVSKSLDARNNEFSALETKLDNARARNNSLASDFADLEDSNLICRSTVKTQGADLNGLTKQFEDCQSQNTDNQGPVDVPDNDSGQTKQPAKAYQEPVKRSKRRQSVKRDSPFRRDGMLGPGQLGYQTGPIKGSQDMPADARRDYVQRRH